MADLTRLRELKGDLDDARFGPEKSIQDGDRMVTFKSQNEMNRASRSLDREIQKKEKRRRLTKRHIVTARGL